MTEALPIEPMKALAHPVRSTIIHSLVDGERNVSEIEAVTGIGQPALSQQLAVLRNADLVETRKDGKLIFYAINPGTVRAIGRHLAALTKDDERAAERRPANSGAANFARLTR